MDILSVTTEPIRADKGQRRRRYGRLVAGIVCAVALVGGSAHIIRTAPTPNKNDEPAAPRFIGGVGALLKGFRRIGGLARKFRVFKKVGGVLKRFGRRFGRGRKFGKLRRMIPTFRKAARFGKKLAPFKKLANRLRGRGRGRGRRSGLRSGLRRGASGLRSGLSRLRNRFSGLGNGIRKNFNSLKNRFAPKGRWNPLRNIRNSNFLNKAKRFGSQIANVLPAAVPALTGMLGGGQNSFGGAMNSFGGAANSFGQYNQPGQEMQQPGMMDPMEQQAPGQFPEQYQQEDQQNLGYEGM